MLLRPPFIIGIVIVFGMLCGYLVMSGLQQENGWSTALALLSIGCLMYFVHLYHRLLTAPPDELETKMTDEG